MSVARTFHVPNRLGAVMRRPGGIRASEAIERAETGVEQFREECLKTIGEVMVELDARFGPNAEREGADFEALYTLVLKLIDVSGFVSHTGLDRAAISMCTLVDTMSERGRWRWPAVDVHLDAMRLLWTQGETLSEGEREAVIEGLYKVSKHKPASE
ncbi:chemotaxis protein CheE [Caulobacter segnis]|uniref:chemotaxis protein CheE n=1 Tax=Caulobacter segnis TaxID=88688 RepID=UPI00240FC798|nr:chemotaxis protein CheE [Caulobacter segnis]MDG2521019.1 chemotaxis protein CheE [Caulobacter segnis]